MDEPRSNRAYRPDNDPETRRSQPGDAGRQEAPLIQEQRVTSLCEPRGPNTGPAQIVLRAVEGQLWNGRPDGEMRLNLVNEAAQGYFQPGQHYTITLQAVAAPVAAGGRGEEEDRSRRAR